MSKYDAENLISDLFDILNAQLNTAIAAVETEKVNQGLPATNILPIASFVEQSISLVNQNNYPVCYYGLEDQEAEGIGPNTKQIYKCFIEVIMVDNGMDSLGHNRIHRYARAIKDVIEANYSSFPCSGRILVETVRPVSFKLEQESSEEMRVGGVSIEFTIA